MNRAMLTVVITLLTAFAGASAVPAADAALTSVVGNWQTEPDDGAVGIVQVSVDAAGNMQGRIVGGNHPGLKDVKNPDPAARDIALNQRSELFIHNRQGQIRERDSHGNESTAHDKD